MHSTPRPEFLYLGHSTILCTLPSGKVILIDPWVEHNPACPAAAKELARVDAMLITHAHADHMGDAVELAKKHQPAQVVACYELASWLTGQGVANCVGMNLGGNLDVLGARVSMVRADHSSAISTPDGFVYGGLAAGYVVRLAGGYTFYHAGDTALFSDMELISELYRPELAFLPIGDLFTMDPRHAAIACRLLGISTVIPIHYATFPALTGTAEALAAALLDRGIATEVVALKPGESY
ncbi:MAG TPA: metal-dependent hydrolase [Thermoanaerobaculia bacterium]|jgi:L-ascorbate metabolism protein UlaG (beta-lactamase superfamily)|nr:metal-dependent hydrolase [Thermoanaerobaculia bacterium]